MEESVTEESMADETVKEEIVEGELVVDKSAEEESVTELTADANEETVDIKEELLTAADETWEIKSTDTGAEVIAESVDEAANAIELPESIEESAKTIEENNPVSTDESIVTETEKNSKALAEEYEEDILKKEESLVDKQPKSNEDEKSIKIETESLLSEEQMFDLGYYYVQVVKRHGANIYDGIEEESICITHCDFGKELWVKATQNKEIAEIYQQEETNVYTIKWDDLIVIKQSQSSIETEIPEENVDESQIEELIKDEQLLDEITEQDDNNRVIRVDGERLETESTEEDTDETSDEGIQNEIDLKEAADSEAEEDQTEEPEEIIIDEPIVRSLNMDTSIRGKDSVGFGELVTVSAELVNFKPDDIYSCQWQYSDDGINFYDLKDATDLTYTYKYSRENFRYVWRIVITIDDPE